MTYHPASPALGGGCLYRRCQRHPHTYAIGLATQASAPASMRLVSDMRRPFVHRPRALLDISGALC